MMLRPFGVAVLKGAGTGGSGGTGPAGPAGADGADGAPGASAYQVAVAAGFVGNEAQWLASLVGPPGADGAAGPQGDPGPAGADSTVPGPTGASAYQVAVENGFVGTEAQWLASLVGPPGADGAAGPQGEPGPKGDTGAQGPEGPQGIQGPAGDTQSIKVALTGTAITPADAGLFTKTITGPTTLSVSAVPASPVVASFILELTNGGSDVTFWPGIKWPGGAAPTLTASGRDVLGFYTHDGGASWVGLVLGKDVL